MDQKDRNQTTAPEQLTGVGALSHPSRPDLLFLQLMSGSVRRVYAVGLPDLDAMLANLRHVLIRKLPPTAVAGADEMLSDTTAAAEFARTTLADWTVSGSSPESLLLAMTACIFREVEMSQGRVAAEQICEIAADLARHSRPAAGGDDMSGWDDWPPAGTAKN